MKYALTCCHMCAVFSSDDNILAEKCQIGNVSMPSIQDSCICSIATVLCKSPNQLFQVNISYVKLPDQFSWVNVLGRRLQ